MAAGSEALRRAWEHDSAGREAEAVVEYRAAFEAGINDEDLPGAFLGFGSTLRNVGELEESERVLRDAVTGEVVNWEDPRVLVVPVAGVSFRIEALDDPSFDPGRPLALVPEPEN